MESIWKDSFRGKRLTGFTKALTFFYIFLSLFKWVSRFFDSYNLYKFYNNFKTTTKKSKSKNKINSFDIFSFR